MDPWLAGAVIDGLPIGLALLAGDRISEPNAAWRQITGDRTEDTPAAELIARWRPEDQTLWYRTLADLGDAPVTLTVGADPEGDEPQHWWRLWVTPVAGTEAIALSLIDVTEETLLQRRLTAVAHAAGEASRAKSEFLARVSHELRSPLQGVLGFVQLIRLHPGDPDTPRYLELAEEAGLQMVRLIDELREITSIEEGHVDLSVGAVNLCDVVADVVMMHETAAASRQITLRTVGLETPAVLASDRRRLHQILANLVSNGIKYNSDGGDVTIEVVRDGHRITVAVRDTGPGLSAAQLERMYTPFDRLGAEGGDVEGTGIGLVVARQLAEALGGSLSVQSEVGVGSAFTLHMQCPVPHAVDRPLSMLCVDDNHASRTVIEAAFSGWERLRLRTAGTAEAGLALAAQERPDLLLIDIHLPDGDGCELIPEFRAMADRPLHVVVMSADTAPETLARVQAAGVERFFPKPLKLTELIGYVSSTFSEQ